MGPPKPVPGESEEETLRKKREYWRVRKKEQRARKAMRDGEMTEKRPSVNWQPIIPNTHHPQQLLEEMETQVTFSMVNISKKRPYNIVISQNCMFNH